MDPQHQFISRVFLKILHNNMSQRLKKMSCKLKCFENFFHSTCNFCSVFIEILYRDKWEYAFNSQSFSIKSRQRRKIPTFLKLSKTCFICFLVGRFSNFPKLKKQQNIYHTSGIYFPNTALPSLFCVPRFK
jgi:hypothetical protein